MQKSKVFGLGLKRVHAGKWEGGQGNQHKGRVNCVCGETETDLVAFLVCFDVSNNM